MTRRAALLVPVALIAALQIATFWPGIMVWDAIRQYGQALSGRYDDWHPPAMNRLWRALGLFGAGPAPMMVAQVALYWTGFALLALAAARWRGTRAALATIACALLPIPFWMMGTVLKDSLMAGALLTAAGLIAQRARVARIVAVVLLIATATLRFNAAAACLPLLVAALPRRWTATRARLAVASLVALVPLLAAMPVADRLLQAQKSGVALSLVIYDLGGITHFSGVDAFPPLPVADAATVAARCWSPVSWDSYSWWVDAPCPVGFAAVRTAFAARHIDPTRWWLGQIAHHPVAYAEHRLAHLDRNLRFVVQDAALPGLSLHSDPNPWGYRVTPTPLRTVFAGIAQWSVATPVGWPACWLALAIGLLLLAPRRDPSVGPSDLAIPLLWSAVLYAASYAPLSVATEVRYHVWTMTATALGAVALLARPHPLAGIARWRRMTAIALPAAVTAIAVAARLGG